MSYQYLEDVNIAFISTLLLSICCDSMANRVDPDQTVP